MNASTSRVYSEFDRRWDRWWSLLCIAGSITFLVIGIVTRSVVSAVMSPFYALLAGAYYGRASR